MESIHTHPILLTQEVHPTYTGGSSSFPLDAWLKPQHALQLHQNSRKKFGSFEINRPAQLVETHHPNLMISRGTKVFCLGAYGAMSGVGMMRELTGGGCRSPPCDQGGGGDSSSTVRRTAGGDGGDGGPTHDAHGQFKGSVSPGTRIAKAGLVASMVEAMNSEDMEAVSFTAGGEDIAMDSTLDAINAADCISSIIRPVVNASGLKGDEVEMCLMDDGVYVDAATLSSAVGTERGEVGRPLDTGPLKGFKAVMTAAPSKCIACVCANDPMNSVGHAATAGIHEQTVA